MSGIDCVNLLALILFIIAFDFGLYYLDDKHALTLIYRKYQMDLRSSVQAILNRADKTIKESWESDDDKCKIKSACLDDIYRRLKYRTDESQLNLEGCGFIGLYAGLYGFICLFCIGIFGCQHDATIKTYVLVCSQIVLLLEILIAAYNYVQGDCKKYSRNIWGNIKLILFILLFTGIVSYFDLTYKGFHEFELPFIVISLIVLLFPFILFISHIIISRMRVTFLKGKCKAHIRRVEKCLKAQSHPQG